ncbi:MAG: hypothetical protein HW419_1838 [Deltaproteobacteria bacterium]|nr:hypothetical protein [Deltaproteobacteria bacterium]
MSILVNVFLGQDTRLPETNDLKRFIIHLSSKASNL